MDNDGNKVVWTVVIISAIAIIGLMFVNFMPSQTANIKTAIGNELSSFENGHTSDNSSSSNSSSSTAVGANLLTGTHDDWQSQNAGGWSTGDAITVNVEKNTEYTAQVEIKSDVNTDTWHVEVWGFPNNGTTTKFLGWNQETHVNGGISKVTFNSGNYTQVQINPHVSTIASPTSKVVYWRHEKLEKGSNATDWTR